MSTPSTIALYSQDTKTLKTIYCNSDGYREYVGKMLLEYYNKLTKVKDLIAFGDLSQLNINLSPENGQLHNFNNRQPNVCVFYGRDRDETDVSAKIYENIEQENIHEHLDSFYSYVFIIPAIYSAEIPSWFYLKKTKLKKLTLDKCM